MKRANSIDPAMILAKMPSTDFKGVIGQTSFDSKGDLQHGMVSLYNYQGGHKTLIDVVKM
jgi:branched-chain amino acid transport system substrate-binding protein